MTEKPLAEERRDRREMVRAALGQALQPRARRLEAHSDLTPVSLIKFANFTISVQTLGA